MSFLWVHLAISESLDVKKNFHCVRPKQQLYYLKNNYHQQSTCLALEQKMSEAHRVVRYDCDDDRLAMQWIKKESSNINFQGAFHICQSLNDEMICLSDVPQNLNREGKSFVPLGIKTYNDGQLTADRSNNPLKSRYQQWRLNTKTNQIINFETRLCLTSLDSKPLFNTSTVWLFAAGVRSCTKGINVNMQQQWFLDPIPNC